MIRSIAFFVALAISLTVTGCSDGVKTVPAASAPQHTLVPNQVCGETPLSARVAADRAKSPHTAGPCCSGPVTDTCYIDDTTSIQVGTRSGGGSLDPSDPCYGNETGLSYDGTNCSGYVGVVALIFPAATGFFTFGYAYSYFYSNGNYFLEIHNPMPGTTLNYSCAFQSYRPNITGLKGSNFSTANLEVESPAPLALYAQTACTFYLPGTNTTWNAAGVALRL